MRVPVRAAVPADPVSKQYLLNEVLMVSHDKSHLVYDLPDFPVARNSFVLERDCSSNRRLGFQSLPLLIGHLG